MTITPLDGGPIGQRIKLLRQHRGWSIRHAAQLAGISHTQWSRIERGERSADNRFILAAIANALKIALSDLTGQVGLTAEYERSQLRSSIYQTMQAVIEADLDDAPITEPGPIAPVLKKVELIMALRLKSDYVGATRLLPEVLRGLHAAASGPERHSALRALVLVEDAVSFIIRYMGDPPSSVQAADRAWQAAIALEDPVLLGLASWSQGHAAIGLGLFPRTQRIAERAIEYVQPHLDLEFAPEMLGQLHMLAGYALYAQGDHSGAASAVAEADKIAAKTGQSPALDLQFGPTGISIWKVGMETDGGDSGRAVEIARDADPAGLSVLSVSRMATFYIDTARALANIRKDSEALRMLLTAERMAPQRVRLSPLVVETVRSLLERAKRGKGWMELRGLCERVGVPW